MGVSLVLSDGLDSFGAVSRAEIVLKLQTADQSLVPPAVVTLTRQKYSLLFSSPGETKMVAAVELPEKTR